MTKKYSIAILLLALFCKVEWSHAQNFHVPSRGNQDVRSNFSNGNVDNSVGMHKIQSIKMDYISDNLHLSSDEADKFWPVYHQYQNELNVVLHQKRQNMLNSSKNPQDIVNDNLDYDSKILNIKKHYKDEFARILPSDKLAQFYRSERSFNDEMIKRLKYQKGTDGN
ncbi:MAG: hypothetical protein V5804_15530 [Mucilaginibacter sp.]|uniref:hypothetical protein n=1 Tax=Mucilaginibacter sp. TaxID=1882438 RepID=UPI0034E53A79